MGRSLVRAVLSHGDRCTAVGWTQENTTAQMEKWQNKDCLGLLCDVRVRETVANVIQQSIERWGNVDIIAKYDPLPTICVTETNRLSSAAAQDMVLPCLYSDPKTC